MQPDIIFVSKARADRLVAEGIRGAPDLVVEILSPATAGRDRTVKRKLYERQGVRAYWIVDPDDACVDVWDIESGGREPQRYRDRLPLKIGESSFGSIPLHEIFSPES